MITSLGSLKGSFISLNDIVNLQQPCTVEDLQSFFMLLEVFGYQREIDYESRIEEGEKKFNIDISQIPRPSDQRNDSYKGVVEIQ